MTRQATTQEHHHSVRRLSALQSPSLLENRCRPSPCARAFPGSEYYGGSAPSRTDQWSVHPAPPRPLEADAKGKTQNSSRVHSDSLVAVGARLCPCGFAASTPQSFLAASLAAHAHHLGSSPPGHPEQARAAPSPYPPDLSWCRIKGCHTPVPRVLLSVSLAEPEPPGSTGPSRLCQGCSRPSRHHPDQAAPRSAVLLRQDQRRRSLTSVRITALHGAR